MKKLVVLCLVGVAVVCSAYGQTKRQDIVRLLEITDTRAQALQTFEILMPSLKAMAPQVPDAFWTLFESKMDIDGFVELFIPIYDKYFSHDDIKEMIRFYESPIGRKMLEVTPLLSQESAAVGQAWGQKLGQEIVNELIKQGYY
jgi:hypothetical protein